MKGESKRTSKSTRYTDLLSSGRQFAELYYVCQAGLGAGMTEAIFAVTPSETIKFVPYICRWRTHF